MGPRELIIILVIVLLLFGAPKLPELARSIGKSLNILKEETKNLSDSDKKSSTDTAAPAPGDAGPSTTPSTAASADDAAGRDDEERGR